MVSSLSASPAISLSVGSSGASGIGGHQASSAAVSASVSASVVSRSSSDEGHRLHLRLRQDLPNCLLEGGVGALELATGELVVSEHQNSDVWYHKELSVLKCSVEEHFGTSLSMNKYGISIMGSAQPKGRAVSIRSITIQVFPINGARENLHREYLLAVRR